MTQDGKDRLSGPPLKVHKSSMSEMVILTVGNKQVPVEKDFEKMLSSLAKQARPDPDELYKKFKST